jgi:enamine deaminase RidA (YjgF/YER057c/UK114 family)
LTCIQKHAAAGVGVITLERGSIHEHFVTLTPKGDETPRSLFGRAGEVVHALDGQVISAEVLGMSAQDRDCMPDLARAIDGNGLPIGWVENTRAENLCGLYVWIASGMPVTRICSDGRVIGSLFEDDHARYCRLTGLLPGDVSHDRPEQADVVLHSMAASLTRHDLAFSDVFRTWFYNHDILAWYDEFNQVRNHFFHERKVFDGLVPASTGIGGGNAADAALEAGLLALRPKDPDVEVFTVPSPLQSSARDYGSSFSRAVEVAAPDHRRLYISGTASIDKEGRTVFLDDTRAQVKLTMEVVQAILQSRGMDWADVTRSLAYFKRAEDAPLLEAYRRDQSLATFPVIVAENDVCRDDLLFEIEVDAIQAR